MEHFAIIVKQEHTEVCILKPNIIIMAKNLGNGTINVDISGDDEYGPSVNFTLGCGDFQGRYIEDYDEETQRTILDNMETSIARDIAKFCEQGYTSVGIDTTAGECVSECFYLEDHKLQWQQDYICNLQIYQQEAVKRTLNKQR